ncbi:MAG: peptidoglycan recognition protein family protein [Treponema sp.]|jgi:N-acetylmuramoyl-L-alanine amidase|nr:peptidoglycan recognition protein family protein [Treponema sp.]
MNIQRNLLTANPFSRPGKTLADAKAIVIHWVENAGSTAKQNRDYFESLKSQAPGDPKARYASAHFIVGLEGEAIQCVPCEEMAYHVGAQSYTAEASDRLGSYPNNRTIGIELCHPKNDGRFNAETLSTAAELCALLCIQFGIDPAQGIWTHHGITGKNCPKWFVDHPEEFEGFKRDVAIAISKLKE